MSFSRLVGSWITPSELDIYALKGAADDCVPLPTGRIPGRAAGSGRLLLGIPSPMYLFVA
jgi:hypothetical protein